MEELSMYRLAMHAYSLKEAPINHARGSNSGSLMTHHRHTNHAKCVIAVPYHFLMKARLSP